MAATVTTIVWYDHVLWSDTRMIGRWANSISNKLTYHTKAEAPFNKRHNKTSGAPGDLIASINTRSSRTGMRARAFVLSMAGYGVYVLRGTQGPITPRGRFLALPDNVYVNSMYRPWTSQDRQLHLSVPGQAANNFLDRAWTRVGLEHSSIRGKLRDD